MIIKLPFLLIAMCTLNVYAELTSASSNTSDSHWVLGGFVDNSFNSTILREYILEKDSGDVIVSTLEVQFKEKQFAFSEEVLLSVYSIKGKLLFQSNGYIKVFNPSSLGLGSQNLVIVSQNQKGNIRKQMWSVR